MLTRLMTALLAARAFAARPVRLGRGLFRASSPIPFPSEEREIDGTGADIFVNFGFRPSAIIFINETGPAFFVGIVKPDDTVVAFGGGPLDTTSFVVSGEGVSSGGGRVKIAAAATAPGDLVHLVALP